MVELFRNSEDLVVLDLDHLEHGHVNIHIFANLLELDGLDRLLVLEEHQILYHSFEVVFYLKADLLALSIFKIINELDFKVGLLLLCYSNKM